MSDIEECASECVCRVINSMTNSVSSTSSGPEGDMEICRVPTCGLHLDKDGVYRGHLEDPSYDPNDPANDPNSPYYDPTNIHNRRRFHEPWHLPWIFIPFFRPSWWESLMFGLGAAVAGSIKFLVWMWRDHYMFALGKSVLFFLAGVHLYDSANTTIRQGLLRRKLCAETKAKSSVKIEDPIY